MFCKSLIVFFLLTAPCCAFDTSFDDAALRSQLDKVIRIDAIQDRAAYSRVFFTRGFLEAYSKALTSDSRSYDGDLLTGSAGVSDIRLVTVAILNREDGTKLPNRSGTATVVQSRIGYRVESGQENFKDILFYMVFQDGEWKINDLGGDHTLREQFAQSLSRPN